MPMQPSAVLTSIWLVWQKLQRSVKAQRNFAKVRLAHSVVTSTHGWLQPLAVYLCWPLVRTSTTRLIKLPLKPTKRCGTSSLRTSKLLLRHLTGSLTMVNMVVAPRVWHWHISVMLICGKLSAQAIIPSIMMPRLRLSRFWRRQTFMNSLPTSLPTGIPLDSGTRSAFGLCVQTKVTSGAVGVATVPSPSVILIC